MKPQPRRKFKRCDTVAPSFRRPCARAPMRPCAHAPMSLSPYAPALPLRPCVHAPYAHAPKRPSCQITKPQAPNPANYRLQIQATNPPFFSFFAPHAFHSRMRVCMRDFGCPRPSRPIPAAEIAVFGNYFRSRARAWPLFPSKFSQVGRRPPKVAFLCKSALRDQVLWRKYAEGVIGRCWARGRLCRLTEIIVENLDLKCRFGNNLRALACEERTGGRWQDGVRRASERWRGGSRRKPGAR